MFCELTPDQLASVSPLFAGFDYSLSLQAAIEGLNPGRIVADDAAKPRTALALTVEGYLLAGEHNEPDILEALRQFLHDSIFSGKVYVNGDDTLSLAVHPDAWEARLPELIPTHEAEKLPRYHYLCSQVSLDWRAHLPQGYELRRVDRDLLANTDLARSIDPSEEEIEVYWGSLSHFFERGIGFCVLHGAQEVSHCTADCAAGTQIDVGFWIHPDHRRRGLAAAVVAATVEHCLAVGFRQVGWHCNVENVGSWKTAERVGFRRNREYAYYYIYDLVDHWAELGWHHRKRGDYVRSTGYHERVFAARTENPDHYYHDAALAWAQLGDVDRALRYLNEAANRGWRHADWTRKQQGFALLQALPEFEHVLTRMA